MWVTGHDVLPDNPGPGSHDVVWLGRVDMNKCMRGLFSHFEGARQGPGLRIYGATHGWPSLSLTACALSAHAITKYGSLIAYEMHG